MDNVALLTWGLAALIWLTLASWVLSATLVGLYGLRSLFRRFHDASNEFHLGDTIPPLPSD